MRFRVVKEGGINIYGRHFPQGYEAGGETVLDAFIRYKGGLLRRQNRIIEKIKAVLETLKSNGKVTITTG